MLIDFQYSSLIGVYGSASVCCRDEPIAWCLSHAAISLPHLDADACKRGVGR